MLKKEEFNSLLEELVNEETTEGRRSMIAVDLISDYSKGFEQIKGLEEETTKAQQEKEALQKANMQLFRQQLVGYKEEEEKPKSTITIEAIEQKYRKF